MTPRVSPAPAAPVLRYGATRGGCARRGPGVVPGGVDRPVAGDQQLIIHATRVSDLWHMARHQMLAMCRHGDNTQSSHLTHDGTKTLNGKGLSLRSKNYHFVFYLVSPGAA